MKKATFYVPQEWLDAFETAYYQAVKNAHWSDLSKLNYQVYNKTTYEVTFWYNPAEPSYLIQIGMKYSENLKQYL